MAKKTPENIIRKKKNYLTGLKWLTGFLSNKNRTIQLAEEAVQKYELENSLLKRAMSYVYGYPHIIWYVNKYLNHLFTFNNLNTAELLTSVGYIFDINNRSNSKSFYFLKANELKDEYKEKIKELLFDYFFYIHDRYYNDKELNFYYDLFTNNIIKIEDLMLIDSHMNNGKGTIKFDDLSSLDLDDNNQPTNNQIKDSRDVKSMFDFSSPLPDKIQTFCTEIEQQIMNRDKCKSCSLFGNQIALLDTNAKDFGEIDVFFIGINPNSDDMKGPVKKPSLNSSYSLLREKMMYFSPNVKWMISNIIMCSTKSEKEIGDIKTVGNNCLDVLGWIINKFPGKTYVPMGDKASTMLGVQEKIKKASGKIITREDGINIIPIIHPAAVKNYGTADNVSLFNESFETIYKFVDRNVKVVETITSNIPTMTQKNTKSNKNIQLNNNYLKDKMITEITDDLTFFDVKEVNNQILMIFINAEGEKRYYLTNFEMQFFIKYAQSFKDYSMITDHVDVEVIVDGQTKNNITKKVRETLEKLKNSTKGIQ